MSRLVVNPGTPQVWEIHLKPGANSLGRNEVNDFQVSDPSVSGSHCQVVVSDGSAVLRDSGSTNGTFVGASRIQEQHLQDGEKIRLGSVEMVYYAGQASDAPAAATPVSKPVVRFAKVSAPTAVAPIGAPVAVAAAAPVAPVAHATGDTTPTLLVGARYCKYHPRIPARFLCQKCNLTYCDACIELTDMGGRTARTCRSCGTEVVPVQFQAAPTKGFYAKLPGAFAYPFQGTGVIILLCATAAFAALRFVGGGIFGLFITVALYGFVFLFMQNIILTTTSDESDELCFPDVSSLGGAAFQLGGTIVASFWLALALMLAKYNDVDIPSEALMASVVLGGIYFPMALLAVAMKDSVMAANPLVVIPAMLKAPGKYAITVALTLGVFGIRKLGDLLSGAAGSAALHTRSQSTFFTAVAIQAVWALLSVYLLTVTMRLLGLFYNGSKRELGWFKF